MLRLAKTLARDRILWNIIEKAVELDSAMTCV
jgi:hypothetical protein